MTPKGFLLESDTPAPMLAMPTQHGEHLRLYMFTWSSMLTTMVCETSQALAHISLIRHLT